MRPGILDLFCGAAGGWSLGMHRAGYTTIAACELIPWRRALFSQNNPGVTLYDDVRELTAARLVRELGWLPDVIVGSPPCQDISSANTQGKGVDGERSGLYFEAVRLVGECRPRWFSFENSANLRTRGADRLVAAFQAIRYAVELCVVGADDVKANHERKRSWLIGYDPDQVTDPCGWQLRQQPGRSGGQNGADQVFYRDDDPAIHASDAHGIGRNEGWSGWRSGLDISLSHDLGDAAKDGWREGRPGGCTIAIEGVSLETCWHDEHAAGVGRFSGRSRGYGPHGDGSAPIAPGGGDAADPSRVGGASRPGPHLALAEPQGSSGSHADGDRQSNIAIDDEMGGGESSSGNAGEPWPDWNGGLAHHLRMDDGLSAWVADTRIALGTPLGTSAASLIVEAFGDAVLPQITEGIGRSILRTDAALRAIYTQSQRNIDGG